MPAGCDGHSPETSCSGTDTRAPLGTQGRRKAPVRSWPSPHLLLAIRSGPVSGREWQNLPHRPRRWLRHGGILHGAAEQSWGRRGRGAPPARSDGTGRDGTVVLNPAPRRGRAGATASGKANSCEVPAVNVILTV